MTMECAIDQRNAVGLDLKTPLNAFLTAFYKRSFAFHTVKNRMPVILTQTIDGLVRKKEHITKIYGEKSADELKAVIGELSKLKYEIQTNKPIRKLLSNTWDAEQYNKYLDHQSVLVDQPTFFNTIWLHAECYMYRRIKEALELTNKLKELDPFQSQKEDAFSSTIQLMTQLGKFVLDLLNKDGDNVQEEFIKLLKLNLWGNKCDLSLSNGLITSERDHLSELDILNSKILSDYSVDIWKTLAKKKDSQIVDIVLDNTGYELFTDLCVADLILRNNYAKKVRFYVKTIPWFVSDVMTKDFKWLLVQLKISNDLVLTQLAERWSNHLDSKTWTIEEHDFWTLPVTFQEMTTYDIELYRKLSEAKLIIFKGDLNYRKLFGETNWLPETAIVEALRGFHPSRLCSLRTLKADIICGLAPGLADEIEKKDKDWLVSGNYGVIQFCDKIIKV